MLFQFPGPQTRKTSLPNTGSPIPRWTSTPEASTYSPTKERISRQPKTLFYMSQAGLGRQGIISSKLESSTQVCIKKQWSDRSAWSCLVKGKSCQIHRDWFTDSFRTETASTHATHCESRIAIDVQRSPPKKRLFSLIHTRYKWLKKTKKQIGCTSRTKVLAVCSFYI